MERLFKTKTSDEWAKLYEKDTNMIIIDPIGWKNTNTNFEYSWFEEEIHQGKFESRMEESVCMSIENFDIIWNKG